MRLTIPCPYLCQYDNKLHPLGSCNLTSLGMALLHYKKDVPGEWERISDNLLDYADKNGYDRHSVDDIAALARKFGVADTASTATSFAQIKTHLLSDNLVIIHGDFTKSGHIILLRGFDSDEGMWYVNDPAGKWPNYGNFGWEPGDGVWYESNWFKKLTGPDGHVWAHLLKRDK